MRWRYRLGRTLGAALLAALSLVLAACGSTSDEGSRDKNKPTANATTDPSKARPAAS